jgi:hypothetical protein
MTSAQREAVRAAWRSGKSQRAVGRSADVHHSTVSKVWKAMEAEDCRPQRVGATALRALADEHPGAHLRVRVRLELRGRYWEPVPLVPPALALYNPHALVSGIGAELLRDLNGALAKP